jgi:hypothetical protein
MTIIDFIFFSLLSVRVFTGLARVDSFTQKIEVLLRFLFLRPLEMGQQKQKGSCLPFYPDPIPYELTSYFVGQAV